MNGRAVRHVGGLASIRCPGQDLKIGLAVQTAHNRASQRIDVVDLVRHASLSGQPGRLLIERLNSAGVSPRGRGANLHRFAFGTIGNHPVWMPFTPRSREFRQVLAVVLTVGAFFFAACRITCAEFLSMCRIVGRIVGTSVVAMRGAIGLVPSASFLSMRRRVCPTGRAPFLAIRVVGLLAVRIAGSVSGYGVCLRLGTILVWSFRVASSLLRGGTLAMGVLIRLLRSLDVLAMRRFINLAVRLQFFLVSEFVGPRERELPRLPFVVRHCAASIWRSMIRRTSSAIEIPNRFASRTRYRRCGSVKEIICFVIPHSIPRVSHAC